MICDGIWQIDKYKWGGGLKFIRYFGESEYFLGMGRK